MTDTDRRLRRSPDDGIASDGVVEAVGKASEALEYVERARGHLYSFHQLMGHADLVFGEAADALAEAGEPDAGGVVERELVGRNVLDGRWTFQIVEEFDDLYWAEARRQVQELRDRFQAGERHVFEARMKERRRSHDQPGHESRPPSAHDDRVSTEE